jgi:hypothetical protein
VFSIGDTRHGTLRLNVALSSGRAFVEIIGRIYEAAEDPLIWPDVLRRLGNEFGSTVNVFTLNNKESPLSEVAVSDGGDPKWEKEYNDYYYSTNIVIKRLMPLLKPGQVISSADAISNDELLNSEYYQDFLRSGRRFLSPRKRRECHGYIERGLDPGAFAKVRAMVRCG